MLLCTHVRVSICPLCLPVLVSPMSDPAHMSYLSDVPYVQTPSIYMATLLMSCASSPYWLLPLCTCSLILWISSLCDIANPAATWTCNPVATWTYNPAATWTCNPVATWTCNPMATWICNPVQPSDYWDLQPSRKT